ncbi:hydantoinase B/oxoprolinase family protein [Thalassotalea psychrophila]|uniref:Hydantoinase B/oxoprolinase family protein n=1 Tax=Thalassotalea psychrophila TaxID=3065647 RepID=A0ABY9U126_9GAMM|nr:hydantoinase B/oxoprolinase family protein [Colwelliaceae bacterium SQ149]
MTETKLDTTAEQNTAEQKIINKFLTEHVSFIGPDQEIQRNHHISARSAREEEVLKHGVDPHLMSEIRSNLQSALDETFGIAEMTVASPAASCGDMSTGYFTPVGDLFLGSTFGVAGFTVSLHYTIRWIMKYLKDDPTVGINEGDGFLINDCHYGGIHSPDQHLFMPIFDKGELVAWNCCAMHEGEIGAKDPGGMGPSIETPWDEGFRGSPVKLVENYKIKRDIATLVQNNSREPHIIMADFKARLAACMRLERRYKEQVAQYEINNIIAFSRSNIEYMRDEAKRRIEALPDGTVRTSLYCDHTMREAAMIRINLNYTIKGDKVIVDYRGSSPEIYNRPINNLHSTVSLGTMITLAHHIWPDLPCAQAVIDNFEFLTDDKNIMNASPEVPVALSMQPMFKMITGAELAFGKFYYGAPKRYAQTKACWFNQPQSIIYGGVNQHHDSVGNMCGDLNGMPGGAKSNADGEHSLSPNFGARTDIGEAEAAEEGLPFVCAISKKFWPDNVGFGKYRGGAGYQFGLMRFGEQPFGFQAICGGSYFPSTMGMFGGYACPTYAVARVRGKNLFEEFNAKPELWDADLFKLMNDQPIDGVTYEALPSAVMFDLYQEGELFMQSQGAGGGYGDVLERDTALTVKDLEEKLVSHETALDLYKMVYDEKSLIVDEQATQNARTAERQARINRGLSWDEFVATHVTDEPPADINYFGSWNDSAELYAGPYPKALPGEHGPLIMPDPKDIKLAHAQAEIAALKAQLAN